MKSDRADVKHRGTDERAFLDLLVSRLSSTMVPTGRIGPGPGKLVYMGRDKSKDSGLEYSQKQPPWSPWEACVLSLRRNVYFAICWATTSFPRHLATGSTCWRIQGMVTWQSSWPVSCQTFLCVELHCLSCRFFPFPKPTVISMPPQAQGSGSPGPSHPQAVTTSSRQLRPMKEDREDFLILAGGRFPGWSLPPLVVSSDGGSCSLHYTTLLNSRAPKRLSAYCVLRHLLYGFSSYCVLRHLLCTVLYIQASTVHALLSAYCMSS